MSSDGSDGPPPPPPRPVRVAFRERLDDLDRTFVDLAHAVTEAILPLSGRALDGDETAIAEANELSIRAGSDTESIHDDGYLLLALEAPVASDLRHVVALLRVSRNADRAASLLRHACESLIESGGAAIEAPLRNALEVLAHRAADVFALGVRSWEDPAAVPPSAVDTADDELDRARDGLLDQIGEVEPTARQALTAGLLARYYERIGDHGLDISRDGAFVATAVRPPRTKGRPTT